MSLIAAADVAGFKVEDGWPATLTPEQVLRLQHYRLGMLPKDFNGSPAVREMARLMRLAIRASVLKHTTTERNVPVEPGRRIISKGMDGGRSFLGGTLGSLPVGYIQPPKFTTETVRHITAEAFGAWLAANEIEPSRHVAAWFKAMGVNTDRRPIEPPAGWKAHIPQGLQKFEDSDAGRLVRLADLVQWLMDTEELPCKAATEEVCSRLEQRPIASAGWLYLLQRNDFATPLTPEHSFYWLPRNAPPDDNPGDPNDNGVAGAINNMRRYWADCDSPDACKFDGAKGLAPLAIPVNVAHLLFDYGRRVEVAEQTQAAAPADPVESERSTQVCADEIDFSELATREQLIAAFGSFTGMDASWFKNLTDTPALLAARKHKGQGGRGHIDEPRFCPFKVMLWLASPKRRKGRSLSEAKAWDLLEKYFPKSYGRNSVADPRNPD